MSREILDTMLGTYTESLKTLPDEGLGALTKIQSALIVTDALETILANQNDDPYARLLPVLEAQTVSVRQTSQVVKDHSVTRTGTTAKADAHERTISLFEAAWTTYSEETFEHSVELIRRRLSSSIEAESFSGAVCFDGGCGTGRFAVAMAELGASRVVAADLGEEMLRFARRKIKERNLRNIEVRNMDVTDLRDFEDESFDFVISNGVLHHTREPQRGLLEHFRVTRRGGLFWLYLYGAGGIYWHVYDALRDCLRGLDPPQVKHVLMELGIREGLVYTFLDNVFAPRVYYTPDQVVELLRQSGPLTATPLKGTSEIDDPERSLQSRHGREIVGPKGEVRLRIMKE